MTPKCAIERKRKPQSTRGRRRRLSERGVQLIEKQKARYSYGVFERQFRRFFEQAAREPGVTGDNLMVILERRIDNVVYRLGFADSRSQARQLVRHGHIKLSDHTDNIPSSLVKEGDTLSFTESSKKTEYYKQLFESIKSKAVPNWLSLDRETLTGKVLSLPTPDEAEAKFSGKTIVEYYSR